MATESDIPVGSKWQYRHGTVFTVVSIEGDRVNLRTPGNGESYWYVSKWDADMTRIDQPPEKAGEGVPVGSRWVIAAELSDCRERLEVEVTGPLESSPFFAEGGYPIRVLNSRRSILSGWRASDFANGTLTRLDTPQEAPPAMSADEHAALARAGYRPCQSNQCRNRAAEGRAHCETCGRLRMDSVVAEAKAKQRAAEVCLTTCGPATPCLTTEMCRSRDTQERAAYARTVLDADDMYIPKRPRTGPPQPGINGMGSLVGGFSYELPRHKRAR